MPDDQAPPAALNLAESAKAWCRDLGRPILDLQHLAGDISARRYYRARPKNGDAVILAHYPSDLAPGCDRFLRTRQLLDEVGIRTPAVIASDCNAGWMMLEDLGPRTLFQQESIGWAKLEPWFRRAGSIVRQLRTIDPEQVKQLSPPLDGGLLRRELAMTEAVFFGPRELCGDRAAARALGELFDRLAEALAKAPSAPCHRDLMARNLIPLADGKLAVIDHQDLRIGPRQYDLASLLNDSLFPPPGVRAALIAGLVTGEAERLDYHRCAAQRTLKAIGSFAAFTARGNDRYEGLIPTMLKLALEHLTELPEATSEITTLAALWRPLLGAERRR